MTHILIQKIVLLRRAAAVLLTASAIVAGGCSTSPKHGNAATPKFPRPAAVSTGDASYYASKFQGRLTASGERFDNEKFTAAHRTLPFGTKVRVTNLSNGRSVVVRVNDRGPFVRGRVIDLSQAAARRLEMVRAGVVPVRLQAVGASPGRAISRAD